MDKEYYYVYIVKCRDNSLYTGYTNNLEKRIKEHNESRRGAKYTRGRRPVTLAYYERFETPNEAMSREWHIKKLTRKEKEQLIQNFSDELKN